MNWGSWNEFFAMGGYAFYVWGSYAVTAIALLIEITALVARRKTTFERLQQTANAKGVTTP